jgi:hypothetical protein
MARARPSGIVERPRGRGHIQGRVPEKPAVQSPFDLAEAVVHLVEAVLDPAQNASRRASLIDLMATIP